MKIIATSAHQASTEDLKVLALANDADPLVADLAGVQRIDLHFPKFSDGRAFCASGASTPAKSAPPAMC